ncbi:hypothetical protein [Actinomadura sp. DC4]|uniref:hypothetical protein n=1 Tax=Actinomadura sp. DC4 TaxID=3055069 RepID=UPI0025B110A2|nr:hypothetical protein [Actinomadura sp. DC4]MDN3354767.1 hypothetical protein [Actinomadura sp. DC4]
MAPAPEKDDKDKKDILVQPDDLAKFAGKIRELIPDVLGAKGAVDAVKILPGNFSDAVSFKSLVGYGDGNGRAGSYSKHLTDLNTALTKFAEGLEVMVRNYTDVESLNKDLVQKVQDLVNQVDPLLPQNPAA